MSDKSALETAQDWLGERYKEYVKDPAQKVDLNKDGKADLEQFQAWLSNKGGDISSTAEKAWNTVKENSKEPLDMFKGWAADAKKTASQAVSKGGFLDNNKGALGGMAVLGLLGMMLMGGGMGAILMALVGLLVGSALVDKDKGMLGGLLGGGEDKKTPPPGGTAPAKDAPAAGKQTEIMIGLDGKVVSKSEEAQIVLKGKFTGEPGKEQFVVESMLRQAENAQLVPVDLGKEPLVLNGKNAAEIASAKNLDLISTRQNQAVSGANPAAAPAPQPTSPEATPPQPAPPAPAAPQTPAATTQPSGNKAPLQDLDPVVVTGATVAAVTPNVNLKNPFADDGLNFIPETIRIPDNASAASVAEKKTEKSSDTGSNSVSFIDANGGVINAKIIGLKNGKAVDPSKADVIILGAYNPDTREYTITRSAARGSDGNFQTNKDGEYQLAYVNRSIALKSDDKGMLNLSEEKNRLGVILTVDDAIGRQKATEAEIAAKERSRIAGISQESIQTTVENAKKHSRIRLQEANLNEATKEITYVMVQTGVDLNGKPYHLKMEGVMDPVPAVGGEGRATTDLIIRRAAFVENPGQPLGMTSIIEKDNPIKLSQVEFDPNNELRGMSRNIRYKDDDTGFRTLGQDKMAELMNRQFPKESVAVSAPQTPQTQAGVIRGNSRVL